MRTLPSTTTWSGHRPGLIAPHGYPLRPDLRAEQLT